jgi:hypothetical protein
MTGMNIGTPLKTPRWKDRGSRLQLRDWFTRFSRMYHGVKPTGPWAEYFKNIAWPITHAILPKYLQWQFAKALYNLRYRLAQLRDPSPALVGQLLGAHALDASSRFREFLQQEALAGRIVLAMVGGANSTGQDSIQPATLQRLVLDLERVQSAREWLKETQRYVADRMTGARRSYDNSLTRDRSRFDAEPEALRSFPAATVTGAAPIHCGTVVCRRRNPCLEYGRVSESRTPHLLA